MQNLVFSTLISHASRTRHTVFLFRPDKVFRPLSNRNYFFKKIFCTALFCRSGSRFIKSEGPVQSIVRRCVSTGIPHAVSADRTGNRSRPPPSHSAKTGRCTGKTRLPAHPSRNRSYKSASVEIILPYHHVCTAPYQPS